MKIWKKIPLALKIAVIGIIGVLVIANSKPKPTPKQAKAVDSVHPKIHVVEAVSDAHIIPVSTQGEIKAKRQIDLISEVSGRVVVVKPVFDDGQFFDAGAVLLHIDPQDYEAAVAAERSRVAQAELSLAEEGGRSKQAKKEWRDLGNAESNELFLRKPQIKAAEMALASAKASLEKALKDLDRTKINLPFSGRVQQAYVELGQYVTPGTRLATVYDTEIAEIKLPLTQVQASLVNLPFLPSDTFEAPRVVLSAMVAGNYETWTARLKRVDARIDSTSRMVYAYAEVERPLKGNRKGVPLMIGLFVDAEIEGKSMANVIQLPRSAVFKQNKIYTVDDENRVSIKQISVLHKNDEAIWVRADLPNGIRVVAEKQAYLAEGKYIDPIATNSDVIPSEIENTVSTDRTDGESPNKEEG